MNKKYIQCTLIKQLNNSTLEQVSFIPEKFAKLNEILSLKDKNGHWDHNWKIIKLGSSVFEFTDYDGHPFDWFTI